MIGVIAYILIMLFRAIIYFILRFSPPGSLRTMEVLFYASEALIVALTIYVVWHNDEFEGDKEEDGASVDDQDTSLFVGGESNLTLDEGQRQWRTEVDHSFSRTLVPQNKMNTTEISKEAMRLRKSSIDD